MKAIDRKKLLHNRKRRERRKTFIKSSRLRSKPCSACKADLDACLGISDVREGTIPTTGALTVCAYCGTLLEFATDGYVCAVPDRLGNIPDYVKQSIEAAIQRPIVTEPLAG